MDTSNQSLRVPAEDPVYQINHTVSGFITDPAFLFHLNALRDIASSVESSRRQQQGLSILDIASSESTTTCYTSSNTPLQRISKNKRSTLKRLPTNFSSFNAKAHTSQINDEPNELSLANSVCHPPITDSDNQRAELSRASKPLPSRGLVVTADASSGLARSEPIWGKSNFVFFPPLHPVDKDLHPDFITGQRL